MNGWLLHLAPQLGLALMLAMGVAGVIAGLAARSLGAGRATGLARAALASGALVATAVLAALAAALARGDMSLAYVAGHTDHALPIGYRVAALWAGQEGSLLLWAWMLSLVAAGAAWARRSTADPGEPISLAVLSAVNAFFALVLIAAANPFLPTPGGAPPLGHGLNPMLQHWAMVLHPPTLFAGYALTAVAFAVMVGAVASGAGAGGWPQGVRRWALGSWIFLTAGIALGAWWAYVELGWGGYWAWDPVENASLLPWLTGTALLHTLAVDRHRGQFRVWTASLSALTFILCLVATYITRSGVIQSVHAFAQSGVGLFFLVAIGATAAGSAALIVRRRRSLRSGIEIESLLSREGIFLVANVLLVVMAGVVLAGTFSPVISGMLGAEAVAVGQPFYNRIVAPLGLGLAALMALAPVLTSGKGCGESFRRDLAAPLAVTIVAVAVAIALGIRSAAALACVAIASMAAVLIAVSLARASRSAARTHRVGPLRAALRVVDGNHRRYGGQLAHLGLVLVLIGVAGSSLYAERQNLSLRRGESAVVGDWTVALEGLEQVRGPNYSAVRAGVAFVGPGGERFTLRPEQRFYDMAVQGSAEVDIRSGLGSDLYVALLGWEAGGEVAAVQVLVNPLTAWIWIGSTVLVAGGVFALLPRFAPLPRPATAPARHEPERLPRPVSAHQGI